MRRSTSNSSACQTKPQISAGKHRQLSKRRIAIGTLVVGAVIAGSILCEYLLSQHYVQVMYYFDKVFGVRIGNLDGGVAMRRGGVLAVATALVGACCQLSVRSSKPRLVFLCSVCPLILILSSLLGSNALYLARRGPSIGFLLVLLGGQAVVAYCLLQVFQRILGTGSKKFTIANVLLMFFLMACGLSRPIVREALTKNSGLNIWLLILAISAGLNSVGCSIPDCWRSRLRFFAYLPVLVFGGVCGYVVAISNRTFAGYVYSHDHYFIYVLGFNFSYFDFSYVYWFVLHGVFQILFAFLLSSLTRRFGGFASQLSLAGRENTSTSAAAS